MDCFERFLKIKRMDLAADYIYMVGTKKWKTILTVEFFGLSHWSNGVAND